MNITGAFLEGLSVKSTQIKEVHTSSGKDFKDSFVKASEPLKKEVRKPEEPSRQRTKETDSGKVEKEEAPKDKVQKPESEKTDTLKEKPETESAKVEKPAENPAEDKKEITAVNIISAICAQLQIEPEKLEGILKELDLKPMDLLDKGNLNKVVQKVFEAENPIELLKIPEIGKIIQSLEAEIAKAAEVPVKAVSKEETAAVKSTDMKPEVVAAPNKLSAVTETDEAVTVQEAGTEAIVSDKTPKAVKAVSAEKNNEQSTMNFSDEGSGIFAEANGEISIAQGIQGEFKTLASAQLKAEAVKNVNPQEVVSQIVDKIKIDVKANSSEVKMTIKPESLGEVSLKVTTENGIITAQFIAESQRVKEIIESNFNQLKDALNQQGINISQMSVSVSQGDKERHMQQFQQEKTKSQMRINAILNSIDENGEVITEEVDSKKVYNNKVEYII